MPIFFWSGFSKILISFPFSFPLLFFFSFYFLSSILLDFSKCLSAQNIGCFIQTPLKNNTKHFFEGVVHEQPWSSIVCSSWGFSIVSSFFWRVFFPNSFSPVLFLSFPLLKLSSFYFLCFILLDFSTSLIAQNIEGLIKTPLKNSTQTIFQGGSPWATLIFSSMFVVGVLYCVQLFFEVIFCFTKSCSPFLCYSFCLLLSSILLASSPWFPWCFYGIFIKNLCKFYVFLMVCLWYSMVFLKVCLW